MLQKTKIVFSLTNSNIKIKNPYSTFFLIYKNKSKSFDCPKFVRNYKKNNAWNIRRLDDESFVPANQ